MGFEVIFLGRFGNNGLHRTSLDVTSVTITLSVSTATMIIHAALRHRHVLKAALLLVVVAGFGALL